MTPPRAVRTGSSGTFRSRIRARVTDGTLSNSTDSDLEPRDCNR
jgi:hypothetical protein